LDARKSLKPQALPSGSLTITRPTCRAAGLSGSSSGAETNSAAARLSRRM
jgi:hypothetical protein